MKEKLLVFSLLMLCFGASAQYRWDWGVHLGASNYLGDIGGKDQPRRDFIQDVKMNQTRYVFGGHIRYKADRNISATASILYGRVQGRDSETEYAPRRARNLNFRNDLIELSVRGEYTFYSDNDLGGRGLYNPDFKVFGFVGLAAIYHNPKGYLEEGNSYDLASGWYNLRPLKTEGQTSEYNSIVFGIPMGFGVYFTHNRKYRFGWELGYRITTTDYLDDISKEYAYDHELSSDLSRALANQTTTEIVEEAFGDEAFIYNYRYQNDHTGKKNPRGINNNNDGYIFSTFSAGMLIQSKSRYSRSKYNWFKGRKRRKRARAKF